MTITANRTTLSNQTMNTNTDSDNDDDDNNNNNSNNDNESPAKYHCDACNIDVTDNVRIRCADRHCPDIDLCVICFCSGSEPMKHKTSHDYRVVKPHAFPIFGHGDDDNNWDADEEWLLIQATEKNGVGNWQAVGDYVGSRNKTECERHYLDVYTSSPQWPWPCMDHVLDTTTTTAKSEMDYLERKRQRIQRLKLAPPQPQPETENESTVSSQPTFHELQGYMPLRCEFDTEYENDAEQNIKDMVFSDNDSQQDIELKVMVLDIYNSRLDKRQERKRLMLEHGWLAFKKLQAMDHQRQHRDIYDKTRVFCRLQTANDHDLFVQGLVKEKNLRDRMAALMDWRRAGIHTLRQGEQYERDKKHRRLFLKKETTRNSSSSSSIGGSSQYQHQNGIRTQKMAGLAVCRRTDHYKEKRHKLLPHSNNLKRQATTTSSPSLHPLNIRHADGYHLLTTEEQDLCSMLFVMPRPYLVIKDVLLRAYAKHGILKRQQLNNLIRIDMTKANHIFDFFMKRGWIKAVWQQQDRMGVMDAVSSRIQQQQQQQQQQVTGVGWNMTLEDTAMTDDGTSTTIIHVTTTAAAAATKSITMMTDSSPTIITLANMDEPAKG